MDATRVQKFLLQQHNLRVGMHVAEYVLSHLHESGAIPVIGRDARTGLAVRTTVELDSFLRSPPAEPLGFSDDLFAGH